LVYILDEIDVTGNYNYIRKVAVSKQAIEHEKSNLDFDCNNLSRQEELNFDESEIWQILARFKIRIKSD